MSVAAIARLARWLGPWADATAVPPGIATRDEIIDGDLRQRIYSGPRDERTYLVAPGLHYAGADDPRMDRFCRILAYAGGRVVAPFIPDYLALKPHERAKRDFERAFLALPRDRKPIVFSISFGSLLAFSLAATHGDAIERVVIFGGYSDLPSTLHFALTGEVLASGRVATRDPLNQPVVIGNLVDRPAVIDHWHRYVRAVWGRAEMKERSKYVAIAEAIARDIADADDREMFLIGVGVLPGARAIAERALETFDAAPFDPGPYLPNIRTRVDLVHGCDDDVIPFEHSYALAARLPQGRVHVTGMYNHTRASLPSPRAMAREVATMIAILRVLV